MLNVAAAACEPSFVCVYLNISEIDVGRYSLDGRTKVGHLVDGIRRKRFKLVGLRGPSRTLVATHDG